jgi:hypothetical protein
MEWNPQKEYGLCLPYGEDDYNIVLSWVLKWQDFECFKLNTEEFVHFATDVGIKIEENITGHPYVKNTLAMKFKIGRRPRSQRYP